MIPEDCFPPQTDKGKNLKNEIQDTGETTVKSGNIETFPPTAKSNT